jgi:hypothetical protein
MQFTPIQIIIELFKKSLPVVVVAIFLLSIMSLLKASLSLVLL